MTDSEKAMISRIPFILTWRQGATDVPDVYSNYLSHLKKKTEGWLNEIADTDPSLVSSFNELPANARLRIVTAPQTYRVVKTRAAPPLERQIAFLSDSIQAERCRLALDSAKKNVWTALGDQYFSPVSMSDSSADSTAGDNYQAPKLMGQIIIDAVSPYSKITLPGDNQTNTSHSQSEIKFIAGRLNEAIFSIEEIRPFITDLIALVTKVIVVKPDLSAPDAFGSSSWSGFIGKTALTNAHSENVGSGQIANALIHEAIHSLLYMVELENSFYLDEGKVCECQVVSPWTGRQLYLASFLHACFVWFGLACFWEQAIEAGEIFSKKEALNCQQRALDGFFKTGLTGLLSEASPHINPEVLEAIDTMQQTITGRSQRA